MTTNRINGPEWHAVIEGGMADVYCTDPECLGDYMTATAARQAVAVGRGLCVGCREAIALTEAAYRTFDPAQ